MMSLMHMCRRNSCRLALLVSILSLVSGQSTSDTQNGTTATTFSTTTESATTTLAAADTTTSTQATVTVQPNPSVIELNTDIAVCTCDLTSFSCDINCCCDTDCSESDRLVFTACYEVSLGSTLDNNQYCVSDTTLFSENSPYVSGTSNNLFCIQVDNNQERSYFTIPNLVKNNEQYKEYENLYSINNQYSYASQITSSPQSTAAVYKSGDTILTLNIQNSTGIFRLPRNANTQECLDWNPVSFMKDENYKCSRVLPSPLSTLCESASYLNAENYYREPLILSHPASANQQRLVIEVTGDSQRPAYDNNTGECHNVVTEVSYLMYHAAGAIEAVTVNIVSQSYNDSLTSLQQSFSIEYRVNQTQEPFTRSGNPGYIVGKPVLAGKRNDTYIILNGDASSYLTVVSSTAGGSCATDSTSRTPVLFGENIRTGCLLRLSSSDLSSCKIIYDQAIDALFGPERSINFDGSIYIASFGNSSPLKVGDWVPLIVPTAPVYPQRCVGVSMNLEILYAQIGSLSNPQARIIGAKLYFEDVSLQLSCLGSNCQPGSNTKQNFEIKSSVTFVDASESPSESIAEKPIYSAKLPQNFFHPFYASSAVGVVFSLNMFTITVGFGLLM